MNTRQNRDLDPGESLSEESNSSRVISNTYSLIAWWNHLSSSVRTGTICIAPTVGFALLAYFFNTKRHEEEDTPILCDVWKDCNEKMGESITRCMAWGFGELVSISGSAVSGLTSLGFFARGTYDKCRREEIATNIQESNNSPSYNAF